ncbi:MAG TPA: Gfo/Idh/MocA family oxidoreductase [Alphaproteobacteria bacterium]
MIRAAIVGLGRWGRNLVTSVQGKSDKIGFVAGTAATPEKSRDFAAQHRLKLYPDYGQILAAPDIDAVVLATPHTQHAELIPAAAQARKHVFTEKPFTLTRGSAEAAVRACANARVTLAVGYNWRFQPALREIKAMLQDGRLGKLLHMEGNFCGPSAYRFGGEHWRQNRAEGPAGGMTGRGVHLVDAMLYLTGPVETVHAQSSRRAQDFGLDDTTSMLLGFKSGVSGYIGTVIATAETWRLQVFGSEGWAEVGDVEHLTTWQLRLCTIDRSNLHHHKTPEIVTFPPTSTERAELEHFADAIVAKRPLAAAGGEDVHAVAVFEAIIKSAQTGTTIRVD